MAKSFFLKEFPDNKVRLSNGKVVQWVLVGHGLGVLETEDELHLKELGKSAETGRFGISAITEERHEELKKNTSLNAAPMKKEWRPTLTAPVEPQKAKPSAKGKSSPVSQAAAAVKAEPVPATDAPPTSTGAPV